MNTIVIAAALLCGVPLGFILGLITGARVYRGTGSKDDDLDYSGGL